MSINLSNKFHHISPDNGINKSISQHDVYVDERNKCHKIRLMLNVGVVCDGSVFNPVTEIINDDGEFVGYGLPESYGDITQHMRFGVDVFDAEPLRSRVNAFIDCDYASRRGRSGLVRDNACFDVFYGDKTFSAKTCLIYDDWYGYRYNKFSGIRPDSRIYKYNYLYNGQRKTGSYNQSGILDGPYIGKYKSNEYMSFNQTLSSKLINENSWFGFKNPVTLFYSDDTLVNLSINSGRYGCGLTFNEPGEFVELYPHKNLYSYAPLYNETNKKEEYNWLSFITYPSRNATPDDWNGLNRFIDYTRNDNGALRFYFADNTANDGTVTFVSPLKHGLRVGDIINIYYKTFIGGNIKCETILTEGGSDVSTYAENIQVVSVPDEYSVTVDLKELHSFNTDDENVYFTYTNTLDWDSNGADQFLIDNGYINSEIINSLTFNSVIGLINEHNELSVEYKYRIVCNNSKNVVIYKDAYLNGVYKFGYYSTAFVGNSKPLPITFSMKKVVNNVECPYYFRMFKSITDNLTITNCSFSKNIYGMDNASVIYEDQIDLDKYKDNLGRPITDIYLTSVKNNQGFHKWYDLSPIDEKIELSHCFSEVNGGFLTNPNITLEDSGQPIRLSIIDCDSRDGKQVYFNNGSDDDEVSKGDSSMSFEGIGDLCMYSPQEYKETILSSFQHRFNTTQREYYKNIFTQTENGYNMFDTFRPVDSPNYDLGTVTPQRYYSFVYTEKSIATLSNNDSDFMYNGMYYQPHSRIRLRSYADEMSYVEPEVFVVQKIGIKRNSNSSSAVTITIGNADLIRKDQNCYLYLNNVKQGNKGTYINASITDRYDGTMIGFTMGSGDVRASFVNNCVSEAENGNIYLVVTPDSIPNNSRLTDDGSFLFAWRELINNGVSEVDGINTCPYTNDTFYVEQNINIYVRRQGQVGDISIDEPTPSSSSPFIIHSYLPKSELIDEIENVPSAYEESEDVKEIVRC